MYYYNRTTGSVQWDEPEIFTRQKEVRQPALPPPPRSLDNVFRLSSADGLLNPRVMLQRLGEMKRRQSMAEAAMQEVHRSSSGGGGSS